MSAMTAWEFADEIVEPTIREFMDKLDRRRGCLACIISYHLGDYLGPTARSDAKDALRIRAEAWGFGGSAEHIACPA